MGGNATYGFILYYELLHAVSAKQCMDGQTLKGNCIRVSKVLIAVFVVHVTFVAVKVHFYA